MLKVSIKGVLGHCVGLFELLTMVVHAWYSVCPGSFAEAVWLVSSSARNRLVNQFCQLEAVWLVSGSARSQFISQWSGSAPSLLVSQFLTYSRSQLVSQFVS